ncbi:MAG TPA: discoidin domain-containing protein [Anaerolineales bacterium]|nr:discoidin domain-containing protein [Anaerolineales bacterium]
MKVMTPVLILVLLLSSCNSQQAQSTFTPELTLPPSPTSSSSPVAPSETPKPLSLDAIPLVWFAPLPPLAIVEGRQFIGSDDFMQLFSPEAPWQSAASHIQVFKLYGEWVAYKATDAQLKQVVDDLEKRGIALAVEAGPLNAPSDCGQGVEGFAGTQEGLNITHRIKNAGGELSFIALDEPYFFAHFYDGLNACKWEAEKVAAEVGKYIETVKQAFPSVKIGDTEPLAGTAAAQAYMSWLDTFRKVNGYNLAFLHIDIDWGRPNWADEVIAIEEYGHMINVPVGIIYTGNPFDKTDEAWISAAGERVKKLELEKNAQPDHILFQSWHDKPDHVLPETADFTFTDFVKDYFTDKSALGLRREGKGANLALGKPVRFSSQTGDQTGPFAVDGDLGTLWNSGGFPRQWIEIDLGAEYNIQEIRLTTSQYPEGMTTHRVLGRSATGEFHELTTFQGNTVDGQILIFTPAQPVQAIRFIRVETISSPSWVAWREIEVIDAGN